MGFEGPQRGIRNDRLGWSFCRFGGALSTFTFKDQAIRVIDREGNPVVRGG